MSKKLASCFSISSARSTIWSAHDESARMLTEEALTDDAPASKRSAASASTNGEAPSAGAGKIGGALTDEAPARKQRSESAATTAPSADAGKTDEALTDEAPATKKRSESAATTCKAPSAAAGKTGEALTDEAPATKHKSATSAAAAGETPSAESAVPAAAIGNKTPALLWVSAPLWSKLKDATSTASGSKSSKAASPRCEFPSTATAKKDDEPLA